MTDKELEKRAKEFAVNNSLIELNDKTHFLMIKETYEIAFRQGQRFKI